MRENRIFRLGATPLLQTRCRAFFVAGDRIGVVETAG